MRTLLFSSALVLLNAVLNAPLAAGQAQPRPEPRPAPITPLTSPSDASRRIDLFTASPRTYAPRFDERPRDRHWQGNSIYAGPYAPFVVPPASQGEQSTTQLRIDIRVLPNEVPRERATPVPAPVPPPPSAAPTPAKPKTFYVIPGCYAGDRPPERTTLREGCDYARLKKIAPR